jgi:hypothetical protein
MIHVHHSDPLHLAAIALVVTLLVLSGWGLLSSRDR